MSDSFESDLFIALAEIRKELRDGCSTAWMTIPTPGLFYWPDVLPSHIPCRAVLRTPDGTLHVLTIHGGTPWTPSHIDAASNLLSALPDPDSSVCCREWASDELADKFDVSLVSIGHALPPDADVGDLFELRRLARAVLLRHISARSTPTPPAADLDVAVERLYEDLERIARGMAARFVSDSLDPELVGLSTTGGPLGVDPALYNYLLCDPTKRNRRQLAALSPGLARAIAAGTDADSRKLRALVDEGQPIVRGMALQFGVRPAAIRTQLRQPHAGSRGLPDKPRALAALLDTMPPERHPLSDANWQHFGHLVSVARRCFPSLRSPAAVAWLREALKTPTPVPPECEAALLEAAARIDCLERALTHRLLESCSAMLSPRGITRIARRVARRHLLSLSPTRQAEIAGRLSGQLHAFAPSYDTAVATPPESWPLIERDYLSRDGTRVASCLVTANALRSVGVELTNCLAIAEQRASYTARLAQGTSHFVAFSEPKSRRVLSVAEIDCSGASHRGKAGKVDVLDHRGLRNAKPSRACRRALNEVVRLISTGPARNRAERERALTTLARLRSKQQRATTTLHVDESFAEAFGAERLRRLVIEVQESLRANQTSSLLMDEVCQAASRPAQAGVHASVVQSDRPECPVESSALG